MVVMTPAPRASGFATIFLSTRPSVTRTNSSRPSREGSFLGTIALLMGCALFTLYLPWSPSALIWPQEWLLVLGWSLLGAVFYLNFRRSATRTNQNNAA